ASGPSLQPTARMLRLSPDRSRARLLPADRPDSCRPSRPALPAVPPTSPTTGPRDRGAGARQLRELRVQSVSPLRLSPRLRPYFSLLLRLHGLRAAPLGAHDTAPAEASRRARKAFRET